MSVGPTLITWLVFAALVLGLLAVVLDRVNFPQKPFQAKRIRTGAKGASRDRTGAHIIDDDGSTEEESSAEGADPSADR